MAEQQAHRQSQHDPVLGLVHLHEGSVSALAEAIARNLAPAANADVPVQTVRLADDQFNKLVELLTPGWEASKIMLEELKAQRVAQAQEAEPLRKPGEVPGQAAPAPQSQAPAPPPHNPPGAG